MDTSTLRIGPKPVYSKDELRTIWRDKVDNVRYAWQEFEQKKISLSAKPFKTIVELTQNCNFRCIMCPQAWEERFQKYHPEYNMPMDTFINVANQLFPKSIFVDLRGFGETTILPHWSEVVDYLECFPLVEWHLVTNLALPRDQVWDKMVRLGFQLGFSCDGATKGTFEAIRVRSNFDRITHNLALISDAMKRHNTGWLYFISTIQKKNIHELRAIVELAHRHSVPEVQFKIVQDGEKHKEGIRELDQAVISGYALQAIDAAIDLGVRVTFNDWLFTRGLDPVRVQQAAVVKKLPPMALFSSPDVADHEYWNNSGMNSIWKSLFEASAVSRQQKCFKPFSFTYVNYNAEVGTCNHMMYPGMLVMGDLKTQSLDEVWNSPVYRNFREQLVMARPEDKRCQWCFKHRLDD